MKKILLLLLVTNFLFAQDSLKIIIKREVEINKKSEKGLKYLNRYFKKTGIEKTLILAKKSIDEYKTTNETDLVLDAQLVVGRFLLDKGKFEESRTILLELKNAASKKNDSLRLGVACYFLSTQNLYLGKFEGALADAEESVLNLGKNRNERILAKAYNNLGVVNLYSSNYKEGLNYFFKSAEIQEKNKFDNDLADTYLNIAVIFAEMEDWERNLFYQRLTLQQYIKTGSKKGLGNLYGNFAITFYKLNELDSADFYNNRAIELAEKTENTGLLVNTLGNMASVLIKRNNWETALPHLMRCKNISKDAGMFMPFCQATGQLAQYNYQIKNYTKSKELATEALAIAEKEEIMSEKLDNYFLLSRIDSVNGNFKSAFNYQLLYNKVYVLQSEERKNKDAIKSSFVYEYAKKSTADSIVMHEERKLKNAELAAKNAKLEQEKWQKIFLLGGLGFVVVALIFVFNRFRVTKKQKKIIEEQKQIVDKAYHALDEKNKEVMDSIYYARRIQRALITPESYINKKLNALQNKP